ncbi:hypothetical protein RRG08_017604 [Elysia crispata]|uniref:Uncharacterized protein n=1 Tax=Elysia crispata TaxID=231223 RepID=A0AAE1D705_9GAST|nr:hypothetical protein RRG08_017604 [Elysia crispata]
MYPGYSVTSVLKILSCIPGTASQQFSKSGHVSRVQRHNSSQNPVMYPDNSVTSVLYIQTCIPCTASQQFSTSGHVSRAQHRINLLY